MGKAFENLANLRLYVNASAFSLAPIM